MPRKKAQEPKKANNPDVVGLKAEVIAQPIPLRYYPAFSCFEES